MIALSAFARASCVRASGSTARANTISGSVDAVIAGSPPVTSCCRTAGSVIRVLRTRSACLLGRLAVQSDAEKWIVGRQLCSRCAELCGDRQTLVSRIDWIRGDNRSLDVLEAGTAILRQTLRVRLSSFGGHAHESGGQLQQLRVSAKAVVAQLWAECR